MAGVNRQAYTNDRSTYNYGDADQFEQECYLLDPILEGDSQWYSDQDVPKPHTSRHTARRLQTTVTQRYGTQRIAQQSRERVRTSDYDRSTHAPAKATPRVTQGYYDAIPQRYRVVPLWIRFCRACGWIFVGMCLMLFLVIAYGPMLLGR